MNNIINKFIGFACYFMSFLFIGYYLILEFSIISVTSPIVRLKIILLVIMLMYFGCLFLIKVNRSFYRKMIKTNIIVWFILYIVMILNLTLFDKYFGRGEFGVSLSVNMSLSDYLNLNFNLVPFKTIGNYILAYKNSNLLLSDFLYNILGNLLAFVPFALFLPRIFNNVNKFYKFFIIVSFFIIFIEVMQMITMSGSFDIDDYILNILGTSIFYYIINISFLKRIINNIIYFNYGNLLI